MEYAIIAAGEGSRLKQEGIEQSKPMVKINGSTLIERLIRIFSENNAEKIFIIINEYSNDLKQHLASIQHLYPIQIIYKTTPSSLHSFYELVPYIKSSQVCLTTVDTIFDENEFKTYINEFIANPKVDALMAATTFIDDESPLYLATDDALNINGFFDKNEQGLRFVSGGMYCLKSSVFSIVNKAIAEGTSRMRNFQKMLVDEGKNVKAFPFSKIIDVDHVSDIAKAETFLSRPVMAE